MRNLWRSALALLIITGAILGLIPPIGKLATGQGAPAILWAFVLSLGAGVLLLGLHLGRRRRLHLNGHRLRFYLLGGIISYATPNLLMFSVIPHLGAGYTGVMFTLSPILTLMMALLLGVRRPSRLGIAGIGVGFVGALMVATTRGELGQPAGAVWVALGLALPTLLAAGNIYREMDWPPGGDPIELAAGSHLAAALLLLVLMGALGRLEVLALMADMPLLVLAQALTAAGMFAFFFRLQQVGGPVYLSQIGYVAAAVGLLIGVFLLGESYAWLTWLGAAVIAIGVALTTRDQTRRSRQGVSSISRT